MGTAALFASSWWIELLEWLVEGAGEDEVEGNGKPENCGFFFSIVTGNIRLKYFTSMQKFK